MNRHVNKGVKMPLKNRHSVSLSWQDVIASWSGMNNKWFTVCVGQQEVECGVVEKVQQSSLR